MIPEAKAKSYDHLGHGDLRRFVSS